jgi:transcriptional regulator
MDIDEYRYHSDTFEAPLHGKRIERQLKYATVVALLNQGLSYRQIANQIDTSTATISRIAQGFQMDMMLKAVDVLPKKIDQWLESESEQIQLKAGDMLSKLAGTVTASPNLTQININNDSDQPSIPDKFAEFLEWKRQQDINSNNNNVIDVDQSSGRQTTDTHNQVQDDDT